MVRPVLDQEDGEVKQQAGTNDSRAAVNAKRVG
jgi:hypothetical protein